MAEVKQVSGSFSLTSSSSKKKPPPNFSNNGVSSSSSSSFKHIYDDVVFASNSPLHNSRPHVSFMDDDYAEVFGCSKSSNDCWSIPYSSIPIIDLPRDSGVCSRGEGVDYGGVFGGIDSDSFGLPDGAELFDQLKKKAKTSSAHTLPSYRSQEQTMEATSPGISNQSYEQLPTSGFSKSLDNTKHFVPWINGSTVNATSRPAKSAHVRANSLHEVSTTPKPLSSQTSGVTVNGQSPANVFYQSSDNIKHFELGNNEVAVNATRGPRKASHVRAYSSHEASATQKILSSGIPEIKDNGQSPTNRYCQSSDNMGHIEPENNEVTVNATSGQRKASDVREANATQKTLSSEQPVIKGDGQSPTNGFCQSFDNTKHFEHGSYRISAKAIKGPGNAAAHVRAYSLHDDTILQNTLSSQTPVMKDDTIVADSHFRKKQEKHSRHISLDLSTNKKNNKGGDDARFQKASDMSRSNLVNSSPATCQPSEAAMDDLFQSFDDSKNSMYKTNELSTNRISEASHEANIHSMHESDDALHTNGPRQTTVPICEPVLYGMTPPGIDAKTVEEKGEHSQNTSIDRGANTQNGVCEEGFHKASGLRESTPIDTSHQAFQTSNKAGLSKVVKNDTEFAAGINKVKKKGRRSRMTSLDLSDPSDQHESGGQRKPRFGNSYSFDASHDPCAAHVKVQPSKMYPSSSLPQFFPVESHYKISDNSSYTNSQKNMYSGEVGSPPSLAEEFDVNSAAAVSAATLQRAIEEAEIRIRLAKEFLERNRQGCTNVRFKDTLKVKRTVAKENVLASEIKRFKQSKVDVSFSPVDTEMQPFSSLEELVQKHSITSAQVDTALEDQNKYARNEEFTGRKDGKASELDREEDKCEGGEWEAAKHLNQIISGVKNRIASFMSWQTETEKKEDLKEIETNIPQQQPVDVEHDLKDCEGFKERRIEKNQVATTSVGEAMHRGNKLQLAQEAVEPEENGTAQGFTGRPEKVGNKVDLIRNTAEPSPGKFQFFAFRNQTSLEPLDREVEEKKGHQESRKFETGHEQVPVIDEVKDEHSSCQSEVASLEELDGKCMAQDNNMQDDMYTSDIGSSDGRNDKEVEEPSSLPGHHEMELSHEGDKQGDMNRKGDVCSTNDEIAEMVEDLFSMAVHDTKELDHEEDKQGDMSRKSNESSGNDEIAELVEDLFFVAGHNKKEVAHEVDNQDDTSRASHIGFVSEENVKMVEGPCSFVGHDKKVFTDDEDRQDDMCRNGYLNSDNEEGNKIVEDLYIQTEHEKTNIVNEEGNKIVEELYIQTEHEKTNIVNEEGDKIVEELYIQTEHEKANFVNDDDNENGPNEECEEILQDHSEECEEILQDHSEKANFVNDDDNENGPNEECEKTDKDDECEVLKKVVKLHENIEMLDKMKVGGETLKSLEVTEGVYGCEENERDEIRTNHIEEASGHAYGCEEITSLKNEPVEETEEVNVQVSCIAPTENGLKQNEDLLSKAEESCSFVESSSVFEDVGWPYQENTSSEPEMDIEFPVSVPKASELIREVPVPSSLSTESIMEVDWDGIKKGLNDNTENFQRENFVSLDNETDMSSEEKDVDVKVVEPQYQDNSENETDYWHESQESLHVEECDTATGQDIETSGSEAIHRRRRWFDHRESITSSERPSILEGNQTDLEIDQEILDETELAGSVEIHDSKLDCSAAEVLDETEFTGGVEIHASKPDCSATEVTSAREAGVSFDQYNSSTNVETTPKRRRWFVKRGEEGVPEPLSLFEGVKVNLEVPPESTDETLLHKDTISGNCLDPLNSKFGEPLNAVKSDVANNGEKGKQSGEAAPTPPRRKRWFESRESVGSGQQVRIDGDVGLTVELDQEPKRKEGVEMHAKHGSVPISQEKDGVHDIEDLKEQSSGKVEVNKREKEKEKEKLAVERAIREARERAFAEARERAKRDAAEKPNLEARQKVAAAAQEKPGKVSSEATSSSDKASVEAKLKAERAAVERATSEARERALQKALSDKSSHRSRELGGKYSTEKNSSLDSKYQSSRCSDASSSSDKFEGTDVESTQRRKARMERQKRTTERAAKALDEKNKRDLVAQKEQAAKNMLADALDAEVRRWSTGKEGNLRAMLSTLQYILGPDSGWQPVSLTDLVAATAVRKAYKKATLCVHPDKLQQRGASIQQKHICEKVFDLLKEAWSRFNPDER